MRRRLLGSILGVALLALVLFGVPFGVVVTRVQETRALEAVEAQVGQIAVLVREQARTSLDAELLLQLVADRSGARFTLFTPDGSVLSDAGTGGGAVLAPPDVPTVEHVDGRLVAWVSVPDLPLVLRGSFPDSTLAASTGRTWLTVGGLGLGVLAAAAVAATSLGRRLAAPLEDLADAARRLAGGDFTGTAPRSGLPETDQIAAALDLTAERLGSTLRRSRSAAADASHQLRTPLTALQLELDTLEARGVDVEAAVRQAERLDVTIEEFLALTSPETAPDDVDVAELAGDRIAAWAAVAAARGRQVVVDTEPAPRVRVRPGALGQALQVLLDNALVHGRGTITVRVGPSRARGGDGAGGVRLAVADEGGGPQTSDVSRGPRRGLALARSLVEAEGGHLVLGDGTAAIVLPVRSS